MPCRNPPCCHLLPTTHPGRDTLHAPYTPCALLPALCCLGAPRARAWPQRLGNMATAWCSCSRVPVSRLLFSNICLPRAPMFTAAGTPRSHPCPSPRPERTAYTREGYIITLTLPPCENKWRQGSVAFAANRAPRACPPGGRCRDDPAESPASRRFRPQAGPQPRVLLAPTARASPAQARPWRAPRIARCARPVPAPRTAHALPHPPPCRGFDLPGRWGEGSS
mmetsp:Transcript_1209/g.4934  ORF Transcript_1209/g.4934 Transcript_1209/m.4934 type:complete len:223 (+) Transcript_1209:91-759(+)